MKYSAETIGKLIRTEREKRSWTQKELGKRLGVSGKQVSNYEQGTPIPPIDVLVKLCQVFDCELGYILGEKDYSQGYKIKTAIHNATGLTATSMGAIQKVTGTSRECIEFGYEAEKYRRILNSLLSSQRFVAFIRSVGDLDESISVFQTIDEQLAAEFGSSLLCEAYSHYSNTTDYSNNHSSDNLESELCEAIKRIDESIDNKNQLCHRIKFARYELHESFESLIDDIYPRHYECHF